MEKNIFLIGTGSMAIDYAKVLMAQKHSLTVIGRGPVSASQFEEITGIKPIIGGAENYLKTNPFSENSYVIIATGTQDLMQCLLTVLRAGASKVLVEKPAAVSILELLENNENLKPFYNRVYVAYNRRFYASVIEAQRLIEEDGGLQSMHFEFTEWAHKIEPLQKAPGVKENWFFANSTHVVDLAFYLAGLPADWHPYSKSGKLTWHRKTNFTGAGITEKGVLFSYISNWESAGRWGIELLTDKRRIYLKPLETIGVQNRGTITIADYPFNDSLDRQYKPGLYKQVEEFLQGASNNLLKLQEQIHNSQNCYSKILD